MLNNKLTDLNNHLFEALERLNDDELVYEKKHLELDRAKTISTVGKTIIDNAELMLEAKKHYDEWSYASAEEELPKVFKE